MVFADDQIYYYAFNYIIPKFSTEPKYHIVHIHYRIPKEDNCPKCVPHFHDISYTKDKRI